MQGVITIRKEKDFHKRAQEPLHERREHHNPTTNSRRKEPQTLYALIKCRLDMEFGHWSRVDSSVCSTKKQEPSLRPT